MNRIYIEASIIVDYIKIKMEVEKDRDLNAHFRRELQKLKSLASKYSFVILESSLGEVIGQCLEKGWGDQDVFEILYKFLIETGAKIVRSGTPTINPWSETSEVFDRGSEIIKIEWKDGNYWGMDIHDIWFLSQVSLDPEVKYVWTSDMRMLDYGATYIERVCGRRIYVVESLTRIK